MRISDWSSDVCSSDLGRRKPHACHDYAPSRPWRNLRSGPRYRSARNGGLCQRRRFWRKNHQHRRLIGCSGHYRRSRTQRQQTIVPEGVGKQSGSTPGGTTMINQKINTLLSNTHWKNTRPNPSLYNKTLVHAIRRQSCFGKTLDLGRDNGVPEADDYAKVCALVGKIIIMRGVMCAPGTTGELARKDNKQ